MKLSVIIPIYNMEKYLPRCLDSILQQDFEDVEILLVNDGSTDSSLDICKLYHDKDNRFKIINKVNGGVSSARNVGLDKAIGEYVIFIDPDDYIDKNMFQELYYLAESNSADLIWMNFYKTYRTKEKLEKIVCENKIFDLDKELDIKEFATLAEQKFGMSAFLFSKMYRRSIFKTIRFPYGRLCEDGFVITTILSKSKKVVLSTKAYYHYCQRDDGLCLSRRDDNWHIDWIESRLIQAIVYDDWCKCLNTGLREYKLYRAYRNALLFMPAAMRPKYQASFPILKDKLKELLHSKMPLRHKLSVLKVLLKYKWKFDK